MSKFKNLDVDSNGNCHVGVANRIGELIQGIHDKGGWALPTGTCPSVGVGGHAMGGGKLI